MNPTTPTQGCNKTFSDAIFIHPIVSWNQIAQQLCKKNDIPITTIVNSLCMMHVAMHDVLYYFQSEIEHYENMEQKGMSDLRPSSTFNTKIIPTTSSIMIQYCLTSGAAEIVLLKLFPMHEDLVIEKRKEITKPFHQDRLLEHYLEMGREIGRRIIDYEKQQNRDGECDQSIPNAPYKWNGSNPIHPGFGRRKMMTLKSDKEYLGRRFSDDRTLKVEEPPPCGNAHDIAEIQTVIDIHNRLKSNQVAVCHKWNDVAFPIVWNNMANYRIINKNLDIKQAARTAAYVNISLYDSIIACWRLKYRYWTARPLQRIPNLKPLLNTPSCPSFISEHAVGSAAVSCVLSEIFSSEKNFFASQMTEAANAGLWSGIQFPNDCTQGLVLGKQIGKSVLEDMKKRKDGFIVSNKENTCRNFISQNGSEIVMCIGLKK